MSTRSLKFKVQKANAEPAQSVNKRARLGVQSQLVSKLLHMWASGTVSATQAQVLAQAAILDGAENAELADLASIGAHGAQPGNCHRDLMTKFCGEIALSEADRIDTWLKDPKTGKTEKGPAAVFCPHKVVSSLASYSEFPNLVCGGLVKEFWQKVKSNGDPKLQGHPMCQVPGWESTFIPLWVHGDGAEFQLRDSMMIFSFGFLLCTLAALDSSMLLGAMPKSCTVPRDSACPGTWAPLWRWLSWSFIALFTGKFPKEDPDGQACARAGQWLTPQKYRFVVWSLEGDHEYFSNILHLPHWRNHRMCWDCDSDVTVPGKHWNDLLHNTWVVKSMEEVRTRPCSDHYIFKLPGVTSKNVCHDALHVVFNHGILAHLLGSQLMLLCFPGPNRRQSMSPEDKIALIWQKVQQYYSENQSPQRLSNLKLKMFCDPGKPYADYPHLNTKAAETKHLLPALLYVMQLLNDNSDLHLHIIGAMKAVSINVLLWDSADFVPSSAQADQIQNLLQEYYQHISWLNSWAQSEERYLFHITQKTHMFYHVCRNARYLNPRAIWCFKAEAELAKLSNTANLNQTKKTTNNTKQTKKHRILWGRSVASACL